MTTCIGISPVRSRVVRAIILTNRSIVWYYHFDIFTFGLLVIKCTSNLCKRNIPLKKVNNSRNIAIRVLKITILKTYIKYGDSTIINNSIQLTSLIELAILQT
jgi:hypothetical protein